jgi:hypothetical protein
MLACSLSLVKGFKFVLPISNLISVEKGHHIAQTKIGQAQNQQCNLKDFFSMGILTLKYSINLL